MPVLAGTGDDADVVFLVQTGAVLRYVQRSAKGKPRASWRVLVSDADCGAPGTCEVMPFDDAAGDAPEQQVPRAALLPLEPFEMQMMADARAKERAADLAAITDESVLQLLRDPVAAAAAAAAEWADGGGGGGGGGGGASKEDEPAAAVPSPASASAATAAIARSAGGEVAVSGSGGGGGGGGGDRGVAQPGSNGGDAASSSGGSSAAAAAADWLVAGKQAGNAVFLLKDFTAAAEVYAYLLGRLAKRDTTRLRRDAVVLVRRGRKAVRGIVVGRANVVVAPAAAAAAVAPPPPEFDDSGGSGGGGGCKTDPPPPQPKPQKGFVVLTSTGELRVPKKDVVGVVPTSDEEADIQVTLHLNLARSLLEQHNQLDKAEWHCFMAMTLHPMGAAGVATADGPGGGGAAAAAAAAYAAETGEQADGGNSRKLFAKILFFRARILLARKRFQRAATFAEQALALDPDSKIVQKFVAETIPREKQRELKGKRRLVKQLSVFIKDAVPADGGGGGGAAAP